MPEELEDFIRDQWNILVDLHICIENLKRLYETKYEFEDQFKTHGFFGHHVYQLAFIAVVQLSKLLNNSSNEKRSFTKLCNKLENSCFGEDLRDSTKPVREFVKEKIQENEDAISRIITARNKVFAHKDPNSGVVIPNLAEIEDMVNLSAELFKSLCGHLSSMEYCFEVKDGWGIDYVMLHMSRSFEYDQEELKRKLDELT